ECRSAGDQQPAAEHGPGTPGPHRPHVVDPAGDVHERDHRSGDQAADEPAPRLVVPGEQQVEREDERGVEDQSRGDVDDDRPAHPPSSSVDWGDGTAGAAPGSASRASGAGDAVPGGALGRPVRRPTRASATTPRPAAASTLISPSVSSPRKSTSTTLTTLRPPASGNDRSISPRATVSRSRLPAATRANENTASATAAATPTRSQGAIAGA